MNFNIRIKYLGTFVKTKYFFLLVFNTESKPSVDFAHGWERLAEEFVNYLLTTMFRYLLQQPEMFQVCIQTNGMPVDY
jgi:hypothetical protein